jgi:hypothetical protein
LLLLLLGLLFACPLMLSYLHEIDELYLMGWCSIGHVPEVMHDHSGWYQEHHLQAAGENGGPVRH